MSVDDPTFQARREKARAHLDQLPGNQAQDPAGRARFFDAVYAGAKGDAAMVPWADLAPKPQLSEWLAANPGVGKSAIDIACGLGDNAQAIAAAGYQTTAFDIVDEAIDWARRRFAQTGVTYCCADLFNLPADWHHAFDLVHECYTLQALPEPMLEEAARAICSLTAKGGRLLLYTRWRENGAVADGPPWPLEAHHLDLPQQFGLVKQGESRFVLQRAGRLIPHCFSLWARPG